MLLIFFTFLLLSVKTFSLGERDWILRSPSSFGIPYTLQKVSDSQLGLFESVLKQAQRYIYKTGDGEFIDVVEHFFWGMSNGTAIELGAVDGTLATTSQTAMLEMLGWRRILIEGNPAFRKKLQNNLVAFVANAAICKEEGLVHYVDSAYTSGIIEFMSYNLFVEYNPKLRAFVTNSSNGNAQVLPDTQLPRKIHSVACVPMSKVLLAANTNHINLFILDVEGGELGVLNTVDWESTRFDVIVVETEAKYRPAGYFSQVKEFLERRGYIVFIEVLGRNSIFHHKEFVPSTRPGVGPMTFNGFEACEKRRRKHAAPLSTA